MVLIKYYKMGNFLEIERFHLWLHGKKMNRLMSFYESFQKYYLLFTIRNNLYKMVITSNDQFYQYCSVKLLKNMPVALKCIILI